MTTHVEAHELAMGEWAQLRTGSDIFRRPVFYQGKEVASLDRSVLCGRQEAISYTALLRATDVTIEANILLDYDDTNLEPLLDFIAHQLNHPWFTPARP